MRKKNVLVSVIHKILCLIFLASLLACAQFPQPSNQVRQLATALADQDLMGMEILAPCNEKFYRAKITIDNAKASQVGFAYLNSAYNESCERTPLAKSEIIPFHSRDSIDLPNSFFYIFSFSATQNTLSKNDLVSARCHFDNLPAKVMDISATSENDIYLQVKFYETTDFKLENDAANGECGDIDGGYISIDDIKIIKNSGL